MYYHNVVVFCVVQGPNCFSDACVLDFLVEFVAYSSHRQRMKANFGFKLLKTKVYDYVDVVSLLLSM